MKTWTKLILLVFLGLYGSGCAHIPYRYGYSIERRDTLPLKPNEPQFERGQPNIVLDGLGNVFGVISKVILWDWKVDRHYISPETEIALRTYLHTNDLRNVKVRLNQYNPGDEWSRLFRNEAVGAGWRYTAGILDMLLYTILPGRLFGGDDYNPYSNTINLYSDIPAIGLNQGGHAKDLAKRRYKGTYAFFHGLPVASLFVEARTTGDAISYLRTEGSAEEEKAGYKILYPAYGMAVGGVWVKQSGPTKGIYAVLVIPGHIIGRIKATGVDERRATHPDPRGKW